MDFCKFISKPESWLAIITVLVALLALWQTRKQINLSNKHQLFDRRLEKYSIAKDLLSKYENDREALLTDKEIELNAEIYLNDLTDLPFLDGVEAIVEDPLKAENRDVFFDKCNWVNKSANEIKIVFSGNEAEILGDFCLEYINLIQIICYKYSQESYNIFRSISEEMGDSNFEEICFEPANETIIDVINRIEKIYQDIINYKVENKIIKQIKLK